jgi:hypothetical protein
VRPDSIRVGRVILETAFAPVFDPIERFVGIFEQVVGVVCAVGPAGYADAATDYKLQLVQQDGFLNCRQHACGYRIQRSFVDIFHQAGEFVATETRD